MSGSVIVQRKQLRPYYTMRCSFYLAFFILPRVFPRVFLRVLDTNMLVSKTRVKTQETPLPPDNKLIIKCQVNIMCKMCRMNKKCVYSHICNL